MTPRLTHARRATIDRLSVDRSRWQQVNLPVHLSPSAAAAEDRLGEFRMDVTTETRLDALRRMLDADDDYARRREALLVRLGRKTTPMVTAIGVSCVQDGHAPRRTGKTRVAELKASTALFLRQLTGRQA